MNFISRTCMYIFHIATALFFYQKRVFFNNSGLLVGLVGRPTCQTEICQPPDSSTVPTKPPKTTTTVGLITGELVTTADGGTTHVAGDPITTVIQETTHGSDATTAPSVRCLRPVNASGGSIVGCGHR